MFRVIGGKGLGVRGFPVGLRKNPLNFKKVYLVLLDLVILDL